MHHTLHTTLAWSDAIAILPIAAGLAAAWCVASLLDAAVLLPAYGGSEPKHAGRAKRPKRSTRSGRSHAAAARRRRSGFLRRLRVAATVNAVPLVALEVLSRLVALGWNAVPNALASGPLERLVLRWKLAPYEELSLVAGLVVVIALVKWLAYETIARLRRTPFSSPGRKDRSLRRLPSNHVARTSERRYAVAVCTTTIALLILEPSSAWLGALV